MNRGAAAVIGMEVRSCMSAVPEAPAPALQRGADLAVQHTRRAADETDRPDAASELEGAT